MQSWAPSSHETRAPSNKLQQNTSAPQQNNAQAAFSVTLLTAYSYNDLTSSTTSSEQINIALAFAAFSQQLTQQTGCSNSGSNLLSLQRLPSHLSEVAHTSIEVVSQQPFRFLVLTPLLQLQLQSSPTWHSGWLPYRYETCLFTNKVKKCYGYTQEFADKYPKEPFNVVI